MWIPCGDRLAQIGIGQACGELCTVIIARHQRQRRRWLQGCSHCRSSRRIAVTPGRTVGHQVQIDDDWSAALGQWDSTMTGSLDCRPTIARLWLDRRPTVARPGARLSFYRRSIRALDRWWVGDSGLGGLNSDKASSGTGTAHRSLSVDRDLSLAVNVVPGSSVTSQVSIVICQLSPVNNDVLLVTVTCHLSSH